MEKIKKGKKKGYKTGDNKIKLLKFLKQTDKQTYDAITKLRTKTTD